MSASPVTFFDPDRFTIRDDPFYGLSPAPVRCRWLTAADQSRASSAAIIRLIVDDVRGNGDGHSVTEIYQHRSLRDIKEFVGPTSALIITPAGFVTTRMDWPEESLEGILSGLAMAQQCVDQLDLGPTPPEVLLGLDGCIPCQATPFQSAIHLSAGSRIGWDNAAVKVYATGGEMSTLVGWRLCNRLRDIPAELLRGHILQTSIGPMLVLVCHEAVLFSSRSRKNLKDELFIWLQEYFTEKAKAGLHYAAILTHWQAGRGSSGGSFLNAANNLAAETGLTVVTAMRTPREDLEAAGQRFQVRGPRADHVATLLVEDAS